MINKRVLQFAALHSALASGMRIVGRRTLATVWLITAARIIAGLFDVVGILLLGTFTARALASDGSVGNMLPFSTLITTSPLWTLTASLVALAIRSGASLGLTAALSGVLSRRASAIISETADHLSHLGYEKTAGQNPNFVHYQMTAGIRAGTVGLIGPMSSVLSETGLLVLLTVFLLATNFYAAILTVSLLGTTSFLLYKLFSLQQYRLGQLAGSASVRSVSNFMALLQTYRESYTFGVVPFMIERFVNAEREQSRIQTLQTFVGSFPRHALEFTVIISLGLIAGFSILFQNIETAIILLALFGATAARVLPSLVPLQASLSELHINIGKSSELLSFLEGITRSNTATFGRGSLAKPNSNSTNDHTREAVGNHPSITLQDMSFRYPEMDIDIFSNINCAIAGPGWTSFCGLSGSGKSTLFDILLGLRAPTKGKVLLNGVNASEFVRSNPGYCAYLPQRISVLNASIAENVALGVPIADINFVRVRDLLTKVGLSAVLRRSEDGLSQQISELGIGISGGQLQRLGIARCLYSSPKILLLDESTSGLDAQTRDQIIEMIDSLKSEIRVISISHHSTLIARSSSVFRIENGQLQRVDT